MPENKTKKKDFVEISYTGYANGEIFDSNIEEDLKKLNPESKPEKTIIVIGEEMVVQGLDKALLDKETGKEYEVSFSSKEGFGARRHDLIRTLSLASFKQQKVTPRPGMVLALDNHVVKIIAVSGARVIADFNNPLAGKDLKYKFKILRILSEKDNKEKVETLLKLFLRFTPEFEIKENKAIVKGPEILEEVLKQYKEKFKELTNLELEFEKKETPTQEAQNEPSAEKPQKEG